LPSSREVEEMLTGPGGMFELVDEVVRGITMPVYKNRMPSLRALAELGWGRGNESEHLVSGDRRLGPRDVVEAANSLSRALAAVGVAAGDRVAILSANNPEWVFSFWGVVDMGAVLVGLNGWWKADEILYGLADSGSKVLIADRDRFARVADRLGELPNLEKVYLIDADPAEFGAWAAGVGGARETAGVEGAAGVEGSTGVEVRRFAELVAAPTSTLPDVAIAEDDPAVILYTSGTTGRPKGAVSTHRSMIANVQNTFYVTVAGSMIWSQSDGLGGGQPVALVTAPLFHVTGCHAGIVVGMAAGVKVVMTVGRFDPEQALRLIEDEGVTVFATVPTMVARMVDHPARHDFDLSSVRTVAYGGSPSGSLLQRRVRDTFPNVAMVRNAYGLTESSSAVTVNSGPEMDERPLSVGRPVPGVEVRIVDSTGCDVPADATGEIWMRAAQIMPGYWGKPEETALAVTDGWLHTGDIGYLDDEGYLFVTDRAKDMIIRGGENVYCVEIEDRLIQHPAIADAAVIGVAHPVLGEEVKAIVQVHVGADLTDAEVRAWVAETLADFKVPTYVEMRTERLPRNSTGKLLKNLLREAGAATAFTETL
jgi:long-chain acyl-CoA synthetase